MKKISVFLIICALAFAFTSCVSSISNEEINDNVNFSEYFWDNESAEYLQDVVFVGYADKNKAIALLDALDMVVLDEISELKVLKANYNTKSEVVTKDGFYEVLKDNLYLLDGVRYFERSYKRELIEVEEVALEDIEQDFEASRDGSVDLMDYTWGIKKIRSPEAWELGYTGEGVIVAVIDTGIDLTHPDLINNGIGGFAPYSDTVLLAATDHSQNNTHGTHCAGTIAAADNGFGVTGVAPEANLMTIRIFDQDAYDVLFEDSDFVGDFNVAKGIIWAVNNGADVLSNSWGGGSFSYLINDAFNYAMNNNVVVVHSSGNDHTDEFCKPGTTPNMINVGASNFKDDITEFSSRGHWVSVVAPGLYILSTNPLWNLGAYTYGEPYQFMKGTSMACPHVSGVAALLVQKSEQELGYVDTYKIKKSIELGAKDILAPGFDIDSGYGRVDCVDALAVDFSLIPDAYNLILNFTTASEISDKVESLKYLENVCGVFVTLKNEAGATPPYIAKTNYDGSIEFTDIPAGDYKLYAGVADPTIPALSLVNLLSLENRSAAFYGFNDSISVNGDTEENYSLSNKPALIIDNVEGNFDSLKIALFENFSESEVASKTFDNLPSVNTFNFPADGFAGWYDYYLERTNTTGSATVTGKIRYNNDSSRDISFEFVFGDGEAGSLDPEDDYYVSEGFYVAM